ncbi:MAG: four helix bundle protein [Pirellulales bacterium]|nr:four helix bundle protein [Pirellulales bacterium]
MKYERFEQLPLWKAAADLAERVYAATRHRFFAQPSDLRDQLRRAALSVSNNIAEGFERGSIAELLAFLYIARGSAGEVRSMLHFALRLLASVYPSVPPGSEISNLRSRSTSPWPSPAPGKSASGPITSRTPISRGNATLPSSRAGSMTRPTV